MSKGFVSWCECNMFDSIPAGENIVCDGAGKGMGLLPEGLSGDRPRSSRRGVEPGSGAVAGTEWEHQGARSGTVSGGFGWKSCAGRVWSPFLGWKSTQSTASIMPKLFSNLQDSVSSKAASVPPHRSRRDGLPRTELPPPSFPLSGSQGKCLVFPLPEKADTPVSLLAWLHRRTGDESRGRGRSRLPGQFCPEVTSHRRPTSICRGGQEAGLMYAPDLSDPSAELCICEAAWSPKRDGRPLSALFGR
ncbi:uncharacterized protein LOC128902436 [Rissa tridactyla]|uniref:uncharacterized protein LOC128902436 n=1 Tax=Rissa tridactyla TaxID=75485 RepID=UPI0023BACF08|nr:uncharacterized protein LOC128902436 [Rissa tridactyla]